MSAELHIDWTRCQGRGLCVELLPESLASDPWGYPLSRTSNPEGSAMLTVSDTQLPAAKESVKMCPLAALSLREEPS